jgi:hypothetical protein
VIAADDVALEAHPGAGGEQCGGVIGGLGAEALGGAAVDVHLGSVDPEQPDALVAPADGDVDRVPVDDILDNGNSRGRRGGPGTPDHDQAEHHERAHAKLLPTAPVAPELSFATDRNGPVPNDRSGDRRLHEIPMRFPGAARDASAVIRDLPVDELVGRALAKGAAELAAGLPRLDVADRRGQRALDRWFASWAEQLRAYLDAVSTVLVPAAAERGVLDDRWQQTIAADLVAIDHLVGALGDALGIIAMDLGDRSVWLDRATAFAERLALLVRSQVSQHRRISAMSRAELSAGERTAVVRGVVRLLGTWRARHTVPSLLAHLDPAERQAVLAAAPATTSWWWRMARPLRMPLLGAASAA